MRKILIIFAFLLSAFNALADGMSANDIVLTDDKKSMLDISLSNTSTDIVGLQFNLSLPEGITPVMDGDRVAIEPSDRIRGSYSLKGKKIADGSYLFTFISNDRTPIGGKSGKLFSIALQNTALLPIGSYEANISGVTISDINGNEQSLADARISISVIHSYKLTYKVDGNIYKEVTLNYGAAITPEAEPAKEGYTFSGWSEIPATMPAHDVVVNGSFEVNIYKVSYYVDEELVHQDEVAFGETFELWIYEPDDNDLIFNDWIGEMYDTMPSHDISYKADITNGIAKIYNNPETVQSIFTLGGKQVEKMSQGVYIVRMKDGSTKKIINNK